MNAEYKLYKKGSFIFHSGDVGDYFYLILKGSANVYVPKAYNNLIIFFLKWRRVEIIKKPIE